MRNLLFTIMMTLMMGWAQISEALPITIGFSPSGTINSSSGGSYDVDVIAYNLPAGQIVSAFDMRILYNPALLNTASVTFSSNLGNAGLSTPEALQKVVSIGSGVISFWAMSLLYDSELLTLQGSSGGSITLATLHFNGLAAGSTTLAFDWSHGYDVKGMNNEILAGYGSSSAVPEPGTLLLMGSGLLGLLGLRRRGSLLSRFGR